VTRAGDLRLIAWANAPVLDDAGDVRWVVGTGIDVTDHRRLEEQLRRAARLEAVGQLAGGVAHDFNNLLTAILGYLDLNIPDLDRSSRLSADLRQVKHAAKRASDLTRQLLTFSRLQPYEPQLIDLNAAVAEVSGMLRHLIEEDIRTELDLDEELISVRADPAQIGQVVMNLAVNARDAMPEGGTMTVGTSMADIGAAQALMHPGVAPGGYACLWVADTGVGMDDATRERMFDPFFTTKEVGKGTGLGMSTVYGIVEQHGGFIECESEKGKGTKVSIFLPLASDASLTAGESSVLEFGMLGTETLLLAEDDAAVRKLASRVLQGMGYTVLEAAGGEEALALMDEHEGELDLLITDVVMPDISGIELAERMAAARPGLKVLFTSGYVGKLPKGRLADLEPSQILQKPFRAADLTERVRELLDAD
jgi:signal transduction histidine kinase